MDCNKDNDDFEVRKRVSFFSKSIYIVDTCEFINMDLFYNFQSSIN